MDQKNGCNGSNLVLTPKNSKNPKICEKWVLLVFDSQNSWGIISMGYPIEICWNLCTFGFVAHHCEVPCGRLWSSEMSGGSSWCFTPWSLYGYYEKIVYTQKVSLLATSHLSPLRLSEANYLKLGKMAKLAQILINSGLQISFRGKSRGIWTQIMKYIPKTSIKDKMK